MNHYELEDGYYLAKKDGRVIIIRIESSEKLKKAGYSHKIYKTIVVMGRMGGWQDVDGCDFKRIHLEEL